MRWIKGGLFLVVSVGLLMGCATTKFFPATLSTPYGIQIEERENLPKIIGRAKELQNLYRGEANALRGQNAIYDGGLIGLATGLGAAIIYGAHPDTVGALGLGTALLGGTKSYTSNIDRARLYDQGMYSLQCVISNSVEFLPAKASVEKVFTEKDQLNNDIADLRDALLNIPKQKDKKKAEELQTLKNKSNQLIGNSEVLLKTIDEDIFLDSIRYIPQTALIAVEEIEIQLRKNYDKIEFDVSKATANIEQYYKSRGKFAEGSSATAQALSGLTQVASYPQVASTYTADQLDIAKTQYNVLHNTYNSLLSEYKKINTHKERYIELHKNLKNCPYSN